MKSRLYSYDQGTDTSLFNNKHILVDGKPSFIREWFIMKFYMHVSKLNNSSLVLIKFIARTNYKHKVEKL